VQTAAKSAWAGLAAGFLHTLCGPDHLAVSGRGGGLCVCSCMCARTHAYLQHAQQHAPEQRDTLAPAVWFVVSSSTVPAQWYHFTTTSDTPAALCLLDGRCFSSPVSSLTTGTAVRLHARLLCPSTNPSTPAAADCGVLAQALTPLTIGRSRGTATALGALWGFGHSTGQLILGLVFIVLKVGGCRRGSTSSL
jgi:hypothetical protein